MVLPILLIFLSTAAAAVVAYGTHPDWIVRSHGLTIITTCHRLQWPLTFLCLVLLVLLIALVASGKRRIFWMLGLAPAAALLFYHFRGDPIRAFAVLENPPFTTVANAGTVVSDDDYVVGLRLADTYYAYPYSLLYANPVIHQTDRGRRLLLMWSPFANRATAAIVDHDVRARELDIVSMPANALLLYNSRLGQFINALTCTTPKGDAVTGFTSLVPITKTTWKQWRTLHPETKVLAVPPRYTSGLPTQPILPHFKVPAPAKSDLPADTRIAIVNPGPNALAFTADQITPQAVNFTPDAGPPVLLIRDPQTNSVRAFDRHIQPDLVSDFRPLADPKRPAVALVDSTTHTGWSLAGVAVDGDPKLRGTKLSAVPVDEDLSYVVMKFWYPALTVRHLKPEDHAAAMESPAPPMPATKPARPTRRHRTVRSR